MDRLRILLMSKNEDEASKIAAQLRSQKGYQVFAENKTRSIIHHMANSDIDVLVMNLDHFGANQMFLIDQIRELKKGFKIIILADKINQTVSKAVEIIPGVLILGKTFIDIDKDFKGMFNRAISKSRIAKRQTHRQGTEQPAMVKSKFNPDLIACMLYNLSSSGAYLEFETGFLTVGETIQIIVPLGELGKTHVLQCKVAWHQTRAGGRRSAGLYFVKK